MQVRDVMTRDIEIIHSDITIEEAATIMKRLDIGSLPICHQDQLVGIVTDRDIVVRCIAEREHPLHSKIATIMSSNLVYCYEDDSLNNAIRLMELEQVRRILVLDKLRRLVGIISLKDIALRLNDPYIVGGVYEQIVSPIHSVTILEAA